MFTDSDGRYITAGQWHDEKFYTFTAPEDEQAKAPSYILLGGMKEEEVMTEKVMPSMEKTEVKAY